MEGDIFSPEFFREYLETLKLISHNLEWLFNEAMQGRFDNKEMLEDFWRVTMKIQPNPEYFEMDLTHFGLSGLLSKKDIEAKICAFKDKYKPILENLEEFWFVLDFEEGNLWEEDKEEYFVSKRKCEEIKRSFGNVNEWDCEEFVFDANKILFYFETGSIPLSVINEYFIKYIAEGERMALLNENKSAMTSAQEQKINEVCEMAGNDFWKRLLDAKVFAWKDDACENAEPFLELVIKPKKEAKHFALILFAICVVNDMYEFKIDKNDFSIWEAQDYNTKVVNPQIKLLFGEQMVRDITYQYKNHNGAKYKTKPYGYKKVLNALNIKD